GNGEWGMGNGEWGMGNGEWGMGNGEWGMGNGSTTRVDENGPLSGRFSALLPDEGEWRKTGSSTPAQRTPGSSFCVRSRSVGWVVRSRTHRASGRQRRRWVSPSALPTLRPYPPDGESATASWPVAHKPSPQRTLGPSFPLPGPRVRFAYPGYAARCRCRCS
ncbi:hypothetical protein FKV25_04735, partial [Lysobacter aestuarii]